MRYRNLAASAPRGAIRAKSPQDQFRLAKNALTQRTRGGTGHVEPLNVFHIATAVADEVVVPHARRVESRRAALHGHFPHQTCSHQIPQVVVSRRPGRSRIDAIHGFEDFRRRGVALVAH